MTYSSPSRVAVVRSDARSEPASGSLKPWHQRSRPLMSPGRNRSLIASLPCVADALDEVAEARLRRRAGGGELLVDDHVVDGRQLVAAVRRRPGQRRRSRRRRARCATRPGAPSTRRRSTTLGRPGLLSASQARSRPRNSASSGESRKSIGRLPSRCRAAAARSCAPSSPKQLRSTAARGAGTRGPCTPTCCRCRRAPGSRSRTRCARARAAVRLGHRGRPRAPRPARARRRPTRRAASTLSEPSHERRAPRRAGAAPPGTSRSARRTGDAHGHTSAASSIAPSITPTRSAAVRVTASASHARRSSGATASERRPGDPERARSCDG